MRAADIGAINLSSLLYLPIRGREKAPDSDLNKDLSHRATYARRKFDMRSFSTVLRSSGVGPENAEKTPQKAEGSHVCNKVTND